MLRVAVGLARSTFIEAEVELLDVGIIPQLVGRPLEHDAAVFHDIAVVGHGQRHELGPIRKAFLGKGELPICSKCDGIVKTATISFGQAMPEIQMARAQDETMACDLFIVLGSSLVVYPAAGFPGMAKRKGAKLVIVNRDPTDQDDSADMVIHGEIGATMSRVTGVN